MGVRVPSTEMDHLVQVSGISQVEGADDHTETAEGP